MKSNRIKIDDWMQPTPISLMPVDEKVKEEQDQKIPVSVDKMQEDSFDHGQLKVNEENGTDDSVPFLNDLSQKKKNIVNIHQYSYAFRADQEKHFYKKKKISIATLEKVRDFLSKNHQKLFQESIVNKNKRKNLAALVSEYITHNGIIASGYSHEELIKEVVDSLAGLSVLENLIENESITDINVNGRNEIWVDELGKGYYLTDYKFSSDEQLYSVAMKIVNASGESLTAAKPYVDCKFPGMRINICTQHICGLGISLDIRKFAKNVRINDHSILESNQANEDMIKSIEAFVRGKLNILIVGPTGSGKTELIKYMVKHIPDHERILMLEDTAETRLKDIYPNKHIVPFECRFTPEEDTTVDYIKLLKNALRKNPTRIGVGECRGEEAVYMIEIFNTGHEGGFTTAHANSAPDAVKRLVMMCLRSGMKLDSDVIGKWITSTFDIVIFQEKMEDNVRRIGEIIELIDYKNNEPIYNSLYELVTGKFEKENGKITKIKCHHEQRGFLQMDTVRKLNKRGVELELFYKLISDSDKEVLNIE